MDNIIVNSNQNTSVGSLQVKKTGSISGKVTLQNASDFSFILVGIPGTSFLGTTAADGTFTLTGVPEGNYDYFRAEKTGYNYGMFTGIGVTGNADTNIGSMMLLLSTGPNGSFIINGGETVTPYMKLHLSIAASSNAVLMMVADNNLMNGGTWMPLQSEYDYTTTNAGPLILYMKFADANALSTSAVSTGITIDTNPLAAMISPAGIITNTKPVFAWTATTLTNATYKFQLAGDPGFTNSLISTNGLSNASYALTSQALTNNGHYYYRAAVVDKFGSNWNWSASNFFVDTAGPVLTFVSPTNNGYGYTASTAVTLGCYENLSALAALFWSTNGAAFVANGTGTNFTISNLAKPTATLAVYAVDSLGNIGPTNTETLNVLPVWQVLGTAGFSAGAVSNTVLVFNNSMPYVAFADGAKGYKTTVMQFTNGSWTNLGAAGFSASYVSYMDFTFNSGMPYVVYKGSSYRMTLMQYTNGLWTNMSGTYIHSNCANYTSLAFNGGMPYVAYEDTNNGNARVMQYTNGSWATLGTGGFSAGIATYESLAFNNGMPYVAYRDAANIQYATVMQYTNGSWAGVGAAGFSGASATYLSLAFNSGMPYVAYNSAGATVMQFTNSSWVIVGVAAFSAGAASYTSLAFNNGIPYVAYQDAGNGNYATVMQFTNGSWVTVGAAGFSAGQVMFTNLAVDNGTPYVAYRDAGNGNRATVMVFK